jgi:hypothetical protein
LVSSLEQGERPISSQSSIKLADALQLKGDDRETFRLKAAGTKRKDSLVAYARELPAEILNYVPRMLRASGVDLNTIHSCRLREVGKTEQVEVLFGNGQSVVCSLSVS